MKIKLVVVSMLPVFALAGCSTVQSRIADDRAAFEFERSSKLDGDIGLRLRS